MKTALAFMFAAAIALAAAAMSCGDDAPQDAPAPIAAATVAPTPTSAPTATPTAVPTSTPTPAPTSTPTPTAIPTNTPAPTATPTPTAIPTNTPALAAADAMRVYQDAADAMSALSSYRVQIDEALDLGMGDETKISTDFRYQSPGMSKSKTVIAVGAEPPDEMESVAIGGESYIKTSGDPLYDPNAGEWVRSEFVITWADDFMSGILPASFSADAAPATERADGVETHRLTGSADAGDWGQALTIFASEMDEPLEVSVWIGVADGLIRRITGVSDSAEITMTFSEFDVPVVVEAPQDYVERYETQPSNAELETTVLANGWTRADLPDYGFSVSTPPDWSAFGSAGESYYEVDDYLATLPPVAASAADTLSLATIHYFEPHRMIAFGAESEGGETHAAALILNISATWEDAALSDYVDARIEQTEVNLIIDGAIDRRPETLPAGDAERVEFIFQFPSDVYGVPFDDDGRYAQIQYFLLAEGDAFALTFATAADRIDAMRGVFDEIARTVRVEGRP